MQKESKIGRFMKYESKVKYAGKKEICQEYATLVSRTDKLEIALKGDRHLSLP